jgi:serine/threonine protein kinase
MLITIGTTVYDGSKNKYEVVEGIGQGGFGHVFKIKRKTDGAFYALKTLPALFSDQNTLNAFKHEGQSAVEISHSNVIKYYFFSHWSRIS